MRRLAASTKRADLITAGELNRALRQTGRILVPALKSETPVRTGRLKNSTRFQIQGGPGDQRLEIRQGAKTPEGTHYLPFVVLGTRPHTIVPRGGGVLRFEIGGRTVFAKKVNHPGNRPNKYPQRVLNRARPQIEQITRQAGVRIASRALGE
jgi:hypothetical protein